jgi:hypothetical protein
MSIRNLNRKQNFSIAILVLINGISIYSSSSQPTGTGILHLSSGSVSQKFYMKPELWPETELYGKFGKTMAEWVI